MVQQQQASMQHSVRKPLPSEPVATPTSQQEQGLQVNLAADTAAAKAAQALQASRMKLQQMSSMSNQRSLPVGSSTEAASSKPSRKSARTAVEQTAGRTEKGKGLRHFSLKVCEKVELSGRTTYNQVADELVSEMLPNGEYTESQRNDEAKNIRRRVYDAINVLMATDIIQKEKKDIIWKGYPETSSGSASSAAALERVKAERQQRMAEIEKKQAHLEVLIIAVVVLYSCFLHAHAWRLMHAITIFLQELLAQHNAVKQLLNRSPEDLKYGTAMQLPFILVQVRAICSVRTDSRVGHSCPWSSALPCCTMRHAALAPKA